MTKRVLVLCHGNCWRSPLAAAVLEQSGEPKIIDVRSAGFKYPGRPAAKAVRDVAKFMGLDLNEHRGQLITPELIMWANYIIYMDNGNKKRLDAAIAAVKPSPPQYPDLRLICLGHYMRPPMPKIKDLAFINNPVEFTATIAMICAAATALGDALYYGRL